MLEKLNDNNVKELIIDTLDDATTIWNAYELFQKYHIDITLSEFDDAVTDAIRNLWSDEELIERDIIEPYVIYKVEEIDPQAFLDILNEVESEDIDECIYEREQQDFDVSDIKPLYVEMKFEETNPTDLAEMLGIENIESYGRGDLFDMFKEMYENFGFFD